MPTNKRNLMIDKLRGWFEKCLKPIYSQSLNKLEMNLLKGMQTRECLTQLFNFKKGFNGIKHGKLFTLIVITEKNQFNCVSLK